MPDMPIKTTYSTIDRFREYRTFQSLQGARKYARMRIGEQYDISYTFGYAVSGDGVGKLTVRGGATIFDLFPEAAPVPEPPLPRRLYDPEYFSRSDEDEAAALTPEQEEREYELGAQAGDPRRCPKHGIATSSPDGMFDAPCGRCEYEMDMAAERDADRATDLDLSDVDGDVPF